MALLPCILLSLFILSSALVVRQENTPAPEITNFTVNSTRSIYISWKPLLPVDPPQELLGILVYTKSIADGSVSVFPVSAHSIDFRGDVLQPDTMYEAWVCAVYSGVGEKCTVHREFSTRPESGPPTIPIPYIKNIQITGPFSMTVELGGIRPDHTWYSVIVRSNVRFEHNYRFNNPSQIFNSRVAVDNLPPGTTLFVTVNGCINAISHICTDESPSVTVETQCLRDACAFGFVWRETIPSDHVCVSVKERDDVKEDNQLASSRVQPGGGPDTCKQGFVWREAAPNDHVCVTPETRDLARTQNSLASQRFNPKCTNA